MFELLTLSTHITSLCALALVCFKESYINVFMNNCLKYYIFVIGKRNKKYISVYRQHFYNLTTVSLNIAILIF